MSYMDALLEVQHNIEYSMRRLSSLSERELCVNQKWRLSGLAFNQCEMLKVIDEIIKEVHRSGIGNCCTRCSRAYEGEYKFCGPCELELIKKEQNEN